MHRNHLGKRLTALGLAAVLVLAATGCGDDDDDASENAGNGDDTAAAANLEDFCEASVELSLLFSREEAPTHEVADPLFEQFQDNADELADYDGVADDVGVMVAAANAYIDGQEDAFEGDEFNASVGRVDAHTYESCEAEKGEYSTVEYSFVGIPAEVPAGLNIVKVTNEGNEIHEVALFRKNDGVTQPMSEILDLDEEEGQALVTDAGFTFVGEPGSVSYLYARLTPGSYAAVCFLPVGAVDFPTLETLGESEDAAPHFSQGMITEFSVA